MTTFASLRPRSRRDNDILVAVSFVALIVGGLAAGCASGGRALTGGGGAGGLGGAGGSQPDAGPDGGGMDVPAPAPIDVPTPTFAPSRPSADCAATLATPVAPLLLDATIACAGGGGPTSLAAGVQGVGFVAVGSAAGAGGAGSDTATRVLTVSAQGVVSGDQGPVGARIAGLVAERTGGGVDLVSLAGGVNFFHAVDGGWMDELLLPPGPAMAAPVERFEFEGAGRSPDGSVTVAYTHVIDSYFAGTMATRSAAGSWTGLPLPARLPARSAMAVPPTGPAIFVHANESSATSIELDAWSNGSDAAFITLPKATDGSDAVDSVGAAIDAAGTLTPSFETHGQGVVVARPAGASPRTVALAGTQVAVPVGCPDWPRTSPTALPPLTCTQTGTGGSGRHALAAVGATTWVAYLLTHIDRDVSMSCSPSFSGGSFDCGGEITADRSTSELVVERLAADGGHAVRWRTSVGAGDGIFFMDVDAGAARLLLAFAEASPRAGGPTFRYVALDTTAP